MAPLLQASGGRWACGCAPALQEAWDGGDRPWPCPRGRPCPPGCLSRAGPWDRERLQTSSLMTSRGGTDRRARPWSRAGFPGLRPSPFPRGVRVVSVGSRGPFWVRWMCPHVPGTPGLPLPGRRQVPGSKALPSLCSDAVSGGRGACGQAVSGWEASGRLQQKRPKCRLRGGLTHLQRRPRMRSSASGPERGSGAGEQAPWTLVTVLPVQPRSSPGTRGWGPGAPGVPSPS